jgi:Tol biopolymer transport system component
VFLPDQKHFLYVDLNGPLPFELRVASVDAPADPGKMVARVGSNAAYAQGKILYWRDNALVVQEFDPARLETTGTAVPIAEGIRTDAPTNPIARFAVSPTGLLVYQVDEGAHLAWVDRETGGAKPIGEPVDQIGELQLSPDERTLTFNFGKPGGEKPDVWLMDLVRGVKTRFTSDPADDRNERWTPDGNSIVWVSRRNNRPGDIYRKAVRDNGADQLFYSSKLRPSLGNVSPDGKYLLFSQQGAQNEVAQDLWVLPLAEGEPRQPRQLTSTPYDERGPYFSPNGRWISFEANDSGRYEIYVMPFEGGAKKQVSTAGGTHAQWRRDGKELFYVSPEQDLMTVDVTWRGNDVDFGSPKKLFGGVTTARGIQYAPVGDARKFIVAKEGSSDSAPLTLVQNWPALIKK